MRILGYVLTALGVITLALYLAFFVNPQSQEQEAMNAAWDRFAEDVAELGETVENAPFNKDEKTAAAGYRHIARLLATFLAEFTDFRNPEYPRFSRFPNRRGPHRLGQSGQSLPCVSGARRSQLPAARQREQLRSGHDQCL